MREPRQQMHKAEVAIRAMRNQVGLAERYLSRKLKVSIQHM